MFVCCCYNVCNYCNKNAEEENPQNKLQHERPSITIIHSFYSFCVSFPVHWYHEAQKDKDLTVDKGDIVTAVDFLAPEKKMRV